ncbi:MAG: hypothetical protein ACI83W_002506 [Marinoscillum sp.]|jgi:hypothetical protein
MKTKAELEQDIINITANIHRKFPELSKYISEMPDNASGANTNGIGTKNLKEYYNSLDEVLSEYLKTHETEK